MSTVRGSEIRSPESDAMRERFDFLKRHGYLTARRQKNGAIVPDKSGAAPTAVLEGEGGGFPDPPSAPPDRSESSEQWRSFLAGEGTAPGPEVELSSSPAPRSAIGPPVDWASGRIALDRMAEREEAKRRYLEELTAEILALRPHFFDCR